MKHKDYLQTAMQAENYKPIKTVSSYKWAVTRLTEHKLSLGELA